MRKVTIRGVGLGQGRFGTYLHDGVQGWIDVVDARKAARHQLTRGQIASGDAVRQACKRERGQLRQKAWFGGS